MILLTAYQYHNRKLANAERYTGETKGPAVAPVERRELSNAIRGQERHADASREARFSDTTDPSAAAGPPAANRAKEIKEEAVRLFNRKDYEGALKLFGEVEKPDTQVLLGSGICYFKRGDYQRSISFFRKVLDRDQNNFTALKMIAFAYYRLDDIDQSFADAGKGLSVRNDSQLQALYERLVRERKARQGYTEEDSSHFRILFDGYEQGGVDREILDILEDAYRTIGQDLDYFPPETVTVILYTDRDFYDTTQAPHWSGGLYDGKIRLPIKGMNIQKPVVRKVLFHEYTHVLVHYLAHSCPLWINEGLAEYFSAGYPHMTGQVIPLQDMAKSFAWLSGRNVNIAYRESYSAVSSLIGKYGLYRMKAVLQGFGAGKGPDAAFEDALGITYSQFIARWGKENNSSF
ncbi:MAG: hypothetical protein P8Z71_04485 [Candidatus Sulfobium sp.]